MRAWLLLLAVLATFQTYVQVASTEDISTKFITAISPRAITTTTTTIIKQYNNSDSLSIAKTTTKTKRTITSERLLEPQHKQQQRAIETSTTALSKAFNPLIDLASPLNATTTNLLPSVTSKPSIPPAPPAPAPQTTTSISRTLFGVAVGNHEQAATVASRFLYENSDSDKNIYNNRNHNRNNQIENSVSTDNVIIDIENIQTAESQHHSQSNEQVFEQIIDAKPNQLESATPQRQTIKTNSNEMPPASSINIYNNQHSEMSANDDNRDFHHTDHERLPTAVDVDSDASLPTSTPTTPAPTTTTTPPSHQGSKDHHGAADDNDDDADDDNDDDNDTSSSDTYSSTDIFGEKLKPDPSTLVEIENSLLSLFNMKRPPKIDRSKIVIPEAMKQLYAQIMGHELDSVNIPKPGLLTKSANTVRSFTHQDSKIDDRFPHHHRFRLHFNIDSIPGEEKLKAAELQLSRDAISHAALNPRLANRTRYQVLVYDITRVGVRGKREPSYLLLDNKTIRLNSTQTLSLDVQPAVNRWLATPTKNYGLLVEVRTMRSLKPAPHHHVRLRRSADEPHHTWQHKQPLLFTYTDDGRHKARSIRDVSARSKRAGNGGHHHRRSQRRKNNDEVCRRHALYVDFADVGWSDWIVAPPGYDAFYCHGKCPFPLAEHLNSTNHAVVQTLVNNINPYKVPKACCVPTQLEGISMLYLNDQNTVVLKNYQEMTVVGCGCR